MRVHGSRSDPIRHDPRPAKQDVQRDPALAPAVHHRVGQHRPAGQGRDPEQAAAGAGPGARLRPRRQQHGPPVQAEDPVHAVRRAAAAAGVGGPPERQGTKPGEAGEQRLRDAAPAHPAERGGGVRAARAVDGPGSVEETEQGGDAAAGGGVHQEPEADDRGPRERAGRGRRRRRAAGEQVLHEQPGVPVVPDPAADAHVLGVVVAVAVAQLGELVLGGLDLHQHDLPPGELRELRAEEPGGRGAPGRDLLLAAERIEQVGILVARIGEGPRPVF